jgi:lipopolysaccharide export system permease protein
MELTEDKNTMHISLYDGNQYKEVKTEGEHGATYPFMRSDFKSMYIDIDMTDFNLSRSKEELFKDNYQMLNLKQLSTEIDSQKIRINLFKNDFSKQVLKNMNFDSKVVVNSQNAKKKKVSPSGEFLSNFTRDEKLIILETATNIARNNKSFVESSINILEGLANNNSRYEIEWHKKISLSFACFLLFFIGAPLGAIIRKGGLGMPVVVSVLFFLVFHVLSITGEKMAKEGAIPAWQGVWMASAIVLPIGIFLTYKATRDSSLFDVESYLAPVKKLFSKKNARTTGL